MEKVKVLKNECGFEIYVPQDSLRGCWRGTNPAERIDILNNTIGRDIAKKNLDASFHKLAELALKEQYENDLWVSSKNEDDTISISKQKISKEKYEQSLERLKELDNFGLNAKDYENESKN